jgi:hypothetical protein
VRGREKIPTTLLVQQEIFLSNEVALKRSSLLRSFCDEQEGAVSGQRIMALMIHSEGDETSLEILSVYQCLLTLTCGEKRGNTSDADTQCLVGTTAPAYHRRWRSRSSRRQLAKEESAT